MSPTWNLLPPAPFFLDPFVNFLNPLPALSYAESGLPKVDWDKFKQNVVHCFFGQISYVSQFPSTTIFSFHFFFQISNPRGPTSQLFPLRCCGHHHEWIAIYKEKKPQHNSCFKCGSRAQSRWVTGREEANLLQVKHQMSLENLIIPVGKLRTSLCGRVAQIARRSECSCSSKHSDSECRIQNIDQQTGYHHLEFLLYAYLHFPH